MSLLCIAGGGAVAKVAAAAFTLAWIHTIEKTVWEEDWIVDEDRLVIAEARIQGTGAGMEPPATARLSGGFYRWRPEDGTRTDIVLRRSGAPGTGDWTLCVDGRCGPIGALVPADADPVRLFPCAR